MTGDIFVEKPYFKEIYKKIYENVLGVLHNEICNSKEILEIGSGKHGFIKEIDEKIITSDIKKYDNCDMVINAEKLPFDDESLSAIIGIQVLHHIKNIHAFLEEAKRTLEQKGIIILVEPNWGPISTLLHTYFHTEVYCKSQTLDEALYKNNHNQAVGYVLLKKYKKEFLELIKGLTVRVVKKMTFLEYLVAGGFHRPAYAGIKVIKKFAKIDDFLKPCMGILGIHQIIVFRKECSGSQLGNKVKDD